MKLDWKKIGWPIFNGRFYRGFKVTEVRVVKILNSAEDLLEELNKEPESWKISKPIRPDEDKEIVRFKTFEECIDWIDKESL